MNIDVFLIRHYDAFCNTYLTLTHLLVDSLTPGGFPVRKMLKITA